MSDASVEDEKAAVRARVSALVETGRLCMIAKEYCAAAAHFLDAYEVLLSGPRPRSWVVAAVMRYRADALRSGGELAEAIRAYRLVLAIQQTADDDPRAEAETLVELGIALDRHCDTDAAVAAYGRALEIRQELDDAIGCANVLHNMGIAHQDDGDLDAAATCFLEALSRYELDVSPREIARTHQRLGEVHRDGRDDSAAEAAYTRALALFQTLEGTAAHQAEIHLGLCVVRLNQGQHELAHASGEQAAQLFGELGRVRNHADALRLLGVNHTARDRLAPAESSYRRAVALYETIDDTAKQRADVYNRLGTVCARRGDPDAAALAYVEALGIYNVIGATAQERMTLSNSLGMLHVDLGDYDSAEASFREALRVQQEHLSDTDRRGHILHNLGLVHFHRGAYADAETSFEQALERYEQTPNSTAEQVAVHNNLGLTRDRLGRRDDSDAAYRRALSLRQDLDRGADTRYLAHNLAAARRDAADAASDPDEANRLLGEALDFALDAALDADRRRFQFPTEAARMSWASQVAAPSIELAFALAARLGDADTIADLVAHSRSSGALLVSSDPRSPGASDRSTFIVAAPPINDGPVGPAMTAGMPAAADLGLDEVFRRAPTPALRMPGGRIALRSADARIVIYR